MCGLILLQVKNFSFSFAVRSFVDFACFLQTMKALELLAKFENISGPALDLTDKYMRVVTLYSNDLDIVRKQYQQFKLEPMIARNLPPIAGKINWARQLYRKIEAPMKVFKQRPEILKVSLVQQITCVACANFWSKSLGLQ